MIKKKVVPIPRSLLSAGCPFCQGDSTYWVDEHGTVELVGVCEHFNSHTHGSAVFEKAAERKDAEEELVDDTDHEPEDTVDVSEEEVEEVPEDEL
ncbi:MAG: hypothetical protein R6U17_04225 [Thermoplasmata archaeon]